MAWLNISDINDKNFWNDVLISDANEELKWVGVDKKIADFQKKASSGNQKAFKSEFTQLVKGVAETTGLQVRVEPVTDVDGYSSIKVGFFDGSSSTPVYGYTQPVANSNGQFVHNGQIKSLSYTDADKSGNIKILDAPLYGLREANRQLARNQDRLQKATSGGDRAYTLNRILKKPIETSLSPSTAQYAYNARAIQELQEATKMSGTKQRQDTISGLTDVSQTFNALVKSYVSGHNKGDRRAQAAEEKALTRTIEEMGLLYRTLGPEQAFKEISADLGFRKIISDPTIGDALVRGLAQLSQMGFSVGEVTDEHGLQLAYARGLRRAMNFMLPSGSRKGYQTELANQDYISKTDRSGAFTKGATLVSEWENEQIKAGNIENGKQFDTTKVLGVSQQQLQEALGRRVDYYKKQLEDAKASGDKKAIGKARGNLRRAQNDTLLSVEKEGLILSHQRAKALSAQDTISKNVAYDYLQDYYKDYIESHKGFDPTDENARAEAIQEIAENILSDAYKGDYNRNEDAIQKNVASLLDFDEAGNLIIPSEAGASRKLAIGVQKGGKLSTSKRLASNNLKKYVTPGGTGRAVANYAKLGSATNEGDLLYYLAQVLGVSSDELEGVEGLRENVSYKAKNSIDLATGYFNTALGDYIRKNGGTDNSTTRQGFLDSVKKQLPTELAGSFDRLFKLDAKQNTIVQTEDIEAQNAFKAFLPMYLEAFVRAGSGGERGAFKSIGGIKGEEIADLSTLSLDELYSTIQAYNAGSSKYEDINFDLSPYALSQIYAQHEPIGYGYAASKGGYPASYGYREIGALNRMFGTANLAGLDTSGLKSADLGRHTTISQQQYNELLNYQQNAEKLTWNKDTVDADITGQGGLVFNISDLWKEVENNLPYSDEGSINDLRDVASGLFKKEDYDRFITGKIRSKLEEHWDTLTDKQREGFVNKAGGQAAVDRVIKDRGLKEDSRKAIEKELGVSMMPYGVTAGSDADRPFYFVNDNGQQSRMFVAPHSDYTLRDSDIKGVGTLIDAGGNIGGLESFYYDLAKAAESGFGATAKEDSLRFGSRFQSILDRSKEDLTEHNKGASTFDKAHTVRLPHSMQGLNVAADTVAEEFQPYLNNAIMVSDIDFEELLTPNDDELAEIASGARAWSEVLTDVYSEMMGEVGKERVANLNKELEGLSEGKKQEKLRTAIKNAATLGTEEFNDSNKQGLVSFLLRYPTLTGRDISAVKTFINPEWSGRRGIIGGDQALLDILNADVDGDHLSLMLASLWEAANGGTRDNIAKLRNLEKMDAKTTAISKYSREIFGEDTGKNYGGFSLSDLATDNLSDGQAAFLQKTNKEFTGYFSNIRQAFLQAFSDAGLDFGSGEESEEGFARSIASRVFTNFLSIPEQKGISAKKAGADGTVDLVGWRNKLKNVYGALSSGGNYGSREGLKNIISTMGEAGVIDSSGEDSYGILGSDMTESRIPLNIFGEISSLYDELVNGPTEKEETEKERAARLEKAENLKKAAKNIFGDDWEPLKFIKDKNGNYRVDPTETDTEKFKKIAKSFNADAILSSFGVLSSAADAGKLGAGVTLRKIVTNRGKYIPGHASFKYETGLSDKELKELVFDANINDVYKKIDSTVAGQGFYGKEIKDIFGANEAEWESYRGEKGALSDYLDRLGEDETIGNIGPNSFNSNSPTRMWNRLYPGTYGSKTDYSSILDATDEERKKIQSQVGYNSGEDWEKAKKSFSAIEGGNLTHAVAQTLLSDPGLRKMLVKPGLTDKEIWKGLVDQAETDAELSDSLTRDRNELDAEDHGGLFTELEQFDKDYEYLFSDTTRGTETGHVLPAQAAIAHGIGFAKLLTNIIGNSEKDLKNSRFASEDAMLSVFGGKPGNPDKPGKPVYNRVDASFLSTTKANEQDWLKNLDVLKLQFLSDNASGNEEAQELFESLISEPKFNLGSDKSITSLANKDFYDFLERSSKSSAYAENLLTKADTLKSSGLYSLDWNIADFKTAGKSGDPLPSNIAQTQFYIEAAQQLRELVRPQREKFLSKYGEYRVGNENYGLWTKEGIDQILAGLDSGELSTLVDNVLDSEKGKKYVASLKENGFDNNNAIREQIIKAIVSDNVTGWVAKQATKSPLGGYTGPQLYRVSRAKSSGNKAILNSLVKGTSDFLGEAGTLDPSMAGYLTAALTGMPSSLNNYARFQSLDVGKSVFNDEKETQSWFKNTIDTYRKVVDSLNKIDVAKEKQLNATNSAEELQAAFEANNAAQEFENLGARQDLAIALTQAYNASTADGADIKDEGSSFRDIILATLGGLGITNEDEYNSFVDEIQKDLGNGANLTSTLIEHFEKRMVEGLDKRNAGSKRTSKNLGRWSQIQKELQEAKAQEASAKERLDNAKARGAGDEELKELEAEHSKAQQTVSELETSSDKIKDYFTEDGDTNETFKQNETITKKALREGQLGRAEEYSQSINELMNAKRSQKELTSLLDNKDALNLSQEEVLSIQQRLAEINALINSSVESYLTALRTQIMESGNKDAGKIVESAKKAYDKFVGGLSEENNAFVQGFKLDKESGEISKARGIYSNYYNTQARLQNLQKQLGFETDATKRALLGYEIEDTQREFDRATYNKNTYESETYKSENQHLVGINNRESTRAQFVAQQNNQAASKQIIMKNQQGGALGGLEDKLGGLSAYFFSNYGLYRMLMKAVQAIKQLCQSAKQLDTVMTNLRIVTGDTIQSTRNLISEYSEVASQIGVTTAEFGTSAVEWLRQGYDTAEVIDLVTSSMYLSKLGMLDASAATKDLTSALKGFKLASSESMDVVDKLTSIDLKAATSAGEIAEGLSHFANLGNLAGVDIDTAAAYVATIADVSQQSGSAVGTALKTIISRFGNVKAGAYDKMNVEADGSEDGTSINDVEKVLRKLGISTRSSNLNFKDFDDVLAQIAERWTSLDSVSKKAVAVSFAGVRQQESFVTLLENWDKYNELKQASQNSKGTAERKMQSYKESYDASKSELTAALENLINKAEISQLLKDLNGFLKTLVSDVLPNVIKWFPQVFALLQSVRSFMGTSVWQKAGRKIGGSSLFSGFRSQEPGESIGKRIGRGTREFVFGKNLYGANGKKGTAQILTDNDSLKTTNTEQSVEQPAQTIIGAMENAAASAESIKVSMENAAASAKGGAAAEKEKTVSAEEAVVKAQEELSLKEKELADTALEASVMDPDEYQEELFAKRQEVEAAKEVLREKQKELMLEKQQSGEDFKQLEAEQQQTVQGKTQAASGGGSGKGMAASVAASLALSSLTSMLSAYSSGGLTHTNRLGEDVQSSEGAKKAGKGVSAALGAIPLIGSVLDSVFGWSDDVMKKIDAVRDEVAIVSKEGKEMLNAVSGISGNITSLKDMSIAGSAGDITQRTEIANTLMAELYKTENDGLRKSMQEALSNFYNKDNGKNSPKSLYAVIRQYTNGGDLDRQQAAKALEYAQKQAEISAMKEARAEENYNKMTAVGDALLKDNQAHGQLNGDSFVAKYGVSEDSTSTENTGVSDAGPIVEAIIGGVAAILGGILIGTGVGGLAGGVLLGAGVGLMGGGIVGAISESEAQTEIAQQHAREEWLAQGGLGEQIHQKQSEVDLLPKQIAELESEIRENEAQKSENEAQKSLIFNSSDFQALLYSDDDELTTKLGEVVDYNQFKSNSDFNNLLNWYSSIVTLNSDGTITANEGASSDDVISFFRDLNDDVINGYDKLIDDIDSTIDSQKETLSNMQKAYETSVEALHAMEDYRDYLRSVKDEDNRAALESSLITATFGGVNGKELFLEDATLGQLKRLGASGIYEALAKQSEKDGTLFGVTPYYTDENGIKTISEDFYKIAESVLNGDEEIAAALRGDNYMLSEAVAKLNPNDRFDAKVLENFATAIGTTVDKLSEYTSKLGMLTLSELTKSTTELIEETSGYTSLLTKVCAGTESVTEYMSEIISKYPDLIQYMSDTPTLITKITQKMRQLIEAEFTSQWNELASNEEYFSSVAVPDMLNYAASKGKTIEFQAILDQTSATSIQDLLTYLNGLDENSDDYKLLTGALGSAGNDTTLVSDNYQEELKNFTDYMTKILDMQLDNLNKQKEALEQIASQREYETKILQAQLKLEDAINNKKRVYRAGAGFVYESDQREVKQAKEELDELSVEKSVSKIEKEIALLEMEKDKWSNFWEEKTFVLQEQQAEAFAKEFMGYNMLPAKFESLSSQERAEIGLVGATATQAANMLKSGFDGVDNQLTNSKSSFWVQAVNLRDGITKSFATKTDEIINILKEKKEAAIENVKKSWSNFASTGLAYTKGNATFDQLQNALSTYQSSAQFAYNSGYLNDTNFRTTLGLKASSEEQYAKTWMTKELGDAQKTYTVTDENGRWQKYAVTGQPVVNESDVAQRILDYAQSDDFDRLTLTTKKSIKGESLENIFTTSSEATTFSAFIQDLMSMRSDIRQSGGFLAANLGSAGKVMLYIDPTGNIYTTSKVGDSQSNFAHPELLWGAESATVEGLPWAYTTYATGGMVGDDMHNTLINELGTEAIVTPSGTITALPSNTGIVPADITKNLWALGEVAPNISHLINSVANPSNTGLISSTSNSGVTDESINITNLTMQVSADNTFDADAFVSSIRSRVALTKNLKR